jgi:hypothetical protein
MAYNIQNTSIFNAVAGSAMAGMIGAGAGSSQANTTAGNYAANATVAIAFAEAYDTGRGAAAPSTYEVTLTSQLVQAAFNGRDCNTAQSDTAAFWTTNGEPAAILAAVNEGIAVYTAVVGVAPAGQANKLASTSGKNAAATGAAATTTFDAPAYTPKTTGFLALSAGMSVLDGTVDDTVTFQLRVAAAADPSSAQLVVAVGHVTGDAAATLANIYPCVAGTPITLGIQGTSAGAHNIQSGIGNTFFQIIELQSA